MKRDIEHQKDLYYKLVETESFKKEAAALGEAFKGSIWWVSETGEKISRAITDKPRCEIYASVRPSAKCARKCRISTRFGRPNENICRKKIRSAISKAKKTKAPADFGCGDENFGRCIPIIQGDKIYGYIIICHLKDPISENMTSLFTNFLDTLIRELQKELELAKLYRTIRPRAIALSTIHTIHRILSATLDIDELLPKLARLCLQIFRAKRCCIMLKTTPKKVIMITVGKRGKSLSVREKRCSEVAKKDKLLSRGNIVLTKNRLCTPLADEDIIGAVCVVSKENKVPFDEFDREILITLSEQAAIAIKNARLYKQQEEITLGSIKSMAAILATRTTGAYKVRESFVQLILGMGKDMNLGSEELKSLHYAAILHDAGQIAFPDKLLAKTDKLTGKEYDIIRSHPYKSVSIIKHLGFLKPVKPIILHHHENYDGSGYPKGLKGEEIPLGARIMAVATAFNAMITKRPYRRKVGVKNAISEIKKNSGTQFDPRVVRTFMKVVRSKEIVGLIKRGL